MTKSKNHKSIIKATDAQILKALEKVKRSPKKQRKLKRKAHAVMSNRFKINNKTDAVKAAKALDTFLKNVK